MSNLRKNISKDEIVASKEVMSLKVCNVQIYREEGKILREEGNYGPPSRVDLIEKFEKWEVNYYDDYGWPIERKRDCDYVVHRIE